jgi:hypothetical protein
MKKLIFLLLIPFFAQSQIINDWYDSTAFHGGVSVNSYLKIPTGAGIGKILTSDAMGNASWETLGGGGATGATGATGNTGATGANGSDGATGATGATGSAGSNGATGATGSVSGLQILTYDNTSYQLTGTTTETNMLAVTIPANTISANKTIEVKWRVIRISGTAGSITPRLRVSTSAVHSPVSSATAVAMGVSMGTTNYWQQIKRALVYKSATSTTMFNATTQASTDDATIAAQQTSLNLDWTTTQYLLFTIANSNSGDVSSLEYVSINIIGQ